MVHPVIVIPPKATPTAPYIPEEKTSSAPPIEGANTFPTLLKRLFRENKVPRYFGICSRTRIAEAGNAMAANQTCIISNAIASHRMGAKKTIQPDTSTPSLAQEPKETDPVEPKITIPTATSGGGQTRFQ